MKSNDPNRNNMVRTVRLLTATLFLMIACNQITRLLKDNPTATQGEYQLVTSAHESYSYVIPADWSKTAFNAYGGKDGDLIEEIYPPAKITEEYCRSFISFGGSNYSITEVENRIYNNGQIEGCYIVSDILNEELNMEWRRVSFSFESDRGVESITIRVEKAKYDEARVLTTIDSIRIK
jgi:hypothetical protein